MKELVERYLEAKAIENNAKEARLIIEAELISAINNTDTEGTKTVLVHPFQISVTNKLNRFIDIEQYKKNNWDYATFVEYEPKINLKKLRIAEQAFPQQVLKCITVKPQKPTIKIKEII
ncbi:MAG: hypothetical protein A3K77_00775 [Euryarchaeota archaeon RBG_13_31_8]|nr:MAG: hypothetical protein A3K77_00775 [Euryarchaeota archaeon RBG_13_31_8]